MEVLLFSFSAKGGTGHYPAQLANGLSDYVTTHVICPDDPATEELFGTQVSLHTYQAQLQSGFGALSSGVRGLAELRGLTKEINPDVIHLPFLLLLQSITLVPTLKTLHIPLVGTVHDPIPHSGMTLTPREFNIGSRINATAAHLLDAILVHGEASREQAKKAGYPSDRISIVPHGLMDHFQSYDHADLPTEDSTILFFGNIRPNKGYDRIPAILDKVESQVPDITAVVAGSPSEARFVDNGWIDETVETLRDDDRIELHNRFIPDREVGELFSRSSVVVMPYYDATSSGVAMTAYAYGTPMVATNTGDLGRMLSADGSGIVADRESDEAIGQAIIELLTDDAKRSEIRSCTRRSRQRYSWDNVAKQTVAVYKSVL